MNINNYIDEFKNLHDQYNKTWYPGYIGETRDQILEKRQNLIKKAANEVGDITDEVRKEWFKNYGCMNGWNIEISFKHAIAEVLHERDMKDHPELHKKSSFDRWRCYHVNTCSCGFGDECDSSD